MKQAAQLKAQFCRICERPTGKWLKKSAPKRTGLCATCKALYDQYNPNNLGGEDRFG